MSINSIIEEALQEGTLDCLALLGIQDVEVIFSNESGLEPTNTYCVIDILNHDQIGLTSEATFIPKGDKDEMWFTAFYNILTQFSFIGSNASNVGFDFHHNLKNNRRFIEALQRRNISLVEKSSARKQPQPRETRWVDAVKMDLTFGFAVQTRQEIDWVEFITINGEIFRIYKDE